MIEPKNSRLRERNSRPGVPDTLMSPLSIDAWVASSLLHKAIRRGETELAVRAGVTLYQRRGSAIWRRLLVIAYEDVAAISVNTFENLVSAASDSKSRESLGSELPAVVHIIKELAAAPKDRSTDYLISIAKYHPSLAAERAQCLSAPHEDLLSIIVDRTAPIDMGALAICSLIEAGLSAQGNQKGSAIASLFDTYEALGIPNGVIRTARIAFSRTREILALINPLVWIAMSGDPDHKVIQSDLPQSASVRGIPLYAFDKHTRLGKAAFRRFLAENDEVRDLVLEHVSPRQAPIVVGTAAYYADAAPISTRVDWKFAKELETRGMEADLFRDGIPTTAARSLVEAVTHNIAHLDQVRASLLSNGAAT